MVKTPLSVKRGRNTWNQVVSPFDQPGPVTLSRSLSRDGTSLTEIDDKTPHRPFVGSINSNSSASSSGTTSSTRSDISGDNQSRKGTPITPPSDYGGDVKRLEALPYADDLREVPTLLPSRGLSWESSSDSDRSREATRPSTPQPAKDGEDPPSTGSTNAGTRGFGFVGIHDESPSVRRRRTLGHKKLAHVPKAPKVAKAEEEPEEVDEDERIARISEALGALGLGGKSNSTKYAQEHEGIDKAVHVPKETDEAVVSRATCRTHIERRQQTSFNAAESASSSKEDTVSVFSNSKIVVLPGEVNEQLDADITSATWSLVSTLISDDTTGSVKKEATANNKVSTKKDAAPKKDAAAKRKVAAKKGATATGATTTTATEINPTPTSSSSQGLRGRKETTRRASGANVSNTPDAGRGSTSASETPSLWGSRRGGGTKQQTSTEPITAFFDFNKQKLEPGEIRDRILTTVKKKQTNPQEGFLYIYRSPRCPNRVKIGLTVEKTPDKRIDQWAACGLPISRVQDDKNVSFLHANLAEKLIKEELYNVRCKYTCDVCKTQTKNPPKQGKEATVKMVNHGEWYRISEERALATVTRWRDWLVNDSPYNKDGVLRPGWNLKFDDISKQMITNEEKFVAAWTRPLKAKDQIKYFYRHSVKKLNEEWLKIQTFIAALLHITKLGLDLFYVVVLVVVAFFIWFWISIKWAAAFLIVSAFALLCRSFSNNT